MKKELEQVIQELSGCGSERPTPAGIPGFSMDSAALRRQIRLEALLKREVFTGFVFVLAPLFFKTLDKVRVNGRVNLRTERFVKVLCADQFNHVAKILMAARGQFQLNERRKVDDLGIADGLADGIWIRISDGAGSAASGETSGNEKIKGHAGKGVNETARVARERRKFSRDAGSQETSHAISRNQKIHVFGRAQVPMRR